MTNPSNIRQSLRSAVPSSWVAKVRGWRQRRERTRGLPPWCSEERIHQIVAGLVGEPPVHTSYIDLSGYKEQSAAKVWARTKHGRSTTIVVKRSRGATTGYPAIEGFPGPVGAPERHLYDSGPGPLREWVPQLYAVERPREEEVHYYFEDLFRDHRKVTAPEDRIKLTAFLLEMQEPLRDWLDGVPKASVLQYQTPFPRDFIAYAHDALDAYATATADPDATRFMSGWDSTAKVYLDLDPGPPTNGVHGDFRGDNLFLHRRSDKQFKAVDWEYAGWGWIHNDLASLLKAATPELYESALDLVIERRSEFSADEHRELFHRCRLERAILDAALVAKQRMATSENPRVNADHFALAYSALDELSGTKH